MCPAVLLLVTMGDPMNAAAPAGRLDEYIRARIAEFDEIPGARREALRRMAGFASTQRAKGAPVKLTFICTHNSRRSQMAQVWAALAAAHYGVAGVEAFSGGTEATAFNPRAVAALQRAGVPIEPRGGAGRTDNPHYTVSLGGDAVLVCFSKVYHQPPNPTADFAAVMTCSEADKNCPTVAGAAVRIALPYEDPKAADGTESETRIYDERCAQIAREMLLVMSEVAGRD
jgi:arsenate reductase